MAALGHGGCRRLAGLRQQQRELFAAVARDDLARAPCLLRQHRGHGLQRNVALRVAKQIVVALEVVDVDHQQCQLGAMAVRALHLFGQAHIEAAAVGKAGQSVGG